MEFDEYEYLEKTVENPELSGEKPSANGAGEKDRKKSSKHRSSDDADRDSERRSKRSRSEEKSSREHRDRHRESGSSRHRDRGSPDRRDKERHRDRDRERDREGREAERIQEKERIREREKEKEKEKEMEREREREREKERERPRRSSSRSERHRDEERERYIDKSKERDYRERDRESRHHREKKEDGAAEPEADPERDQRTVFAYQLSLKADERDVYEFFSKAGKVRDVRLIMDRNSRRSKGVGYIEFYDVMSVPMAIALSGQLLLGQPVMVKPSEAEKNLVQSNTTAGGTGLTGPNSGAARRLYVGNLHLNITEPQLRQVFEPFGQVELVQLPLDPLTGLCKGYGFIQFARLEDARAAQSLNGQLEIAGRTIKVSAVTDQTGVQDTGTNAADLDDDEGGGLSLNASSRALLMQKLAGTAGSIPGTLAAPAANPALLTPAASILGPSMIPSILQPSVPPFVGLPTSGLPVASTAAAPPLHTAGVPSECLLLKNMFDPTVESEPDFDLDIKEDVHDECSKFGTVKHIYVDKNSAGYVYLHFDDVTSSMKAQNALHGRWFAGKMITATYMAPQQYMAKFPNAS
ncbi:RNA-binding protein 39-like isoform X2 [Zingiber officinale]|uniref:RNA-binding protein 39-like isoform X2 n=1 Tax=Zingiber officinale TaxID=94328 RepID=UPI001C4A8B44|nr:RNA-binding protein 39-like isoform X2 [Zingiber officinale]